jgi:hypothetical protein
LDDTMSIMPAIVGCVQQGSAGNAPTGVSVATSSSGNYDCSVLLDWQNGSGGSGYPDYDGSNGDCLAATIAIPVTAGAEGGYDDYYGGDITAVAHIKCYMRATGATSYAWTGSITGVSLSNSCSAALANGASVSVQDATVDPCLVLTITHNNTRPSHPEAGDYIVFTTTGTATNSDGSTAATVTHKITFS